MTEINRRNFLRGVLTASAYLTLARSNALASGFETERRFAPVKVARNRIIREVVGLRPYRGEGFVVDAERDGTDIFSVNVLNDLVIKRITIQPSCSPAHA